MSRSKSESSKNSWIAKHEERVKRLFGITHSLSNEISVKTLALNQRAHVIRTYLEEWSDCCNLPCRIHPHSNETESKLSNKCFPSHRYLLKALHDNVNSDARSGGDLHRAI